jgi:hypothetical protein
MKRKWKCNNCGACFKKRPPVVDVGEDFCAEFRYECPNCGAYNGSVKEIKK